MRFAWIVACLGVLAGMSGAEMPSTAHAGEPASSSLPRPEDPLSAGDVLWLPEGPGVEQLADAMRSLAATRGCARPGSENFRHAIDALEAAVASDPASNAGIVPLADAYVDSGNPFAVALACELYVEALAECPQADSLLARAADACLRLGNDGAAFAFTAQRSSSAPERAPAAAAQAALIAVETGNLHQGAALLQQIVRDTRDPAAVRLSRLLTPAMVDGDSGAHATPFDLSPVAVRRFHERRLAATNDPLLSSAARIDRVRAALSEFLAVVWREQDAEPRARQDTVRLTGQAFVRIQEHRRRLNEIAAAADGGPMDDADVRHQALGELRACVAAAELTEPLLRFLHGRLAMACSAEELVGLLASVRPGGQTLAEAGHGAGSQDEVRLDLWQPLVDICQWAALQSDWEQVRFSRQVIRELASNATPVPELLDTVRTETSDALAMMKSALAASHDVEQEMLANQRNAWLYQAEELRQQGRTADADDLDSRLTELQQKMHRRFRERLGLSMAVALLCQSAGRALEPGEAVIGGSSMLLQFKMDQATGVVRPGAEVWFDRAQNLDDWFNADQYAESVVENSGLDAERRLDPGVERACPATRLSLPALVSIVTEAAACLQLDGPDAESARAARWFLASELERMRAEGVAESEVRRWLIEHLRTQCRQSFRGPADDAEVRETEEGERRTDL